MSSSKADELELIVKPDEPLPPAFACKSLSAPCIASATECASRPRRSHVQLLDLVRDTKATSVPTEVVDDSPLAKQDEDCEKELRKQEKLRSRLDAEASVGVHSALIGGFALSLVPEVKDMGAMSTWQRWVFVACMTLSGSLCLLTVATSGTIYWAGTHLLSATKESVRAENDLFRAFWKQPALRAARRYSRLAFKRPYLGSLPALTRSSTITPSLWP
jgi:hypothetical protein